MNSMVEHLEGEQNYLLVASVCVCVHVCTHTCPCVCVCVLTLNMLSIYSTTKLNPSSSLCLGWRLELPNLLPVSFNFHVISQWR